ncbi:unnamed protein product [Owenia fusiformis]|uniref:Uncharacterized protein n=1 Tax=Owenia fusiformis TaxID=6347 RepID=A0A8S4Q5J1_OWEFU|nr:unnamed protein product [Owenia fusiformis]
MTTQEYSNLTNDMMVEDAEHGPPEVITSQKPQQMERPVVCKPVTATYVMAPTTVQPINPNSIDGNYRPRWAHRSALILSIIIMICGGIMLIMNIASLAMEIRFYLPGTGIWGGIAIMVIGGIGVGASRRKSKCLIIAVMVLTIILAVGSTTLFAIQITYALSSIPLRDRDYDFFDRDYVIRGFAISIVMAICFLVAIVSAIVVSALTCRAVCCQPNSFMVQVAYVPPAESCNLAPVSEKLMAQGGHKEAVLATPQPQLQQQFIQKEGLMQH